MYGEARENHGATTKKLKNETGAVLSANSSSIEEQAGQFGQNTGTDTKVQCFSYTSMYGTLF